MSDHESTMKQAREDAAHAYVCLLAGAARPDDDITQALAGVMASSWTRPDAWSAPIVRLPLDERLAMLSELFPSLNPLVLAWPIEGNKSDNLDEIDDVFDLLMAHAGPDALTNGRVRWLARAIATACMGANHLWQDMGLPSRDALNALMQHYFPSLKARNAENMRWKKFFYRELCLAAEVLICKSPSCGQCVDQAVCFGVEQGAALWQAQAPAAAAGQGA